MGTTTASAPGGTPYAPGAILDSTQAHVTKLQHAWQHIAQRDRDGLPLYNLSGLERGLHFPPDMPEWVDDDEWAGALYSDKVRQQGLRHLGGDPDRHDIAVTNRMTAALFAALQVTATPGSTVIGVSPSYSHPAVVRGVRDACADFVDTVGVDAFTETLNAADDVSVVVVTRLAVTYDALSETDLREIIDRAHARGALVVVDDAGGARIGPAILDQPRTLALGADLGATGLDKYGVIGPRVGLLGGRADLVARARSRAFELGSECRPVLYPAVVQCLEQYDSQRVKDLVNSTKTVGLKLRERLGDWVEETPFITRLSAEAIRHQYEVRSGNTVDIAPVEATAALAMCMLRDYGILTVHFAGLPPGTAALLIKFLPPETIAELGGADIFVDAVDSSITKAAQVASDPKALRALLMGNG